MKEGEREGERDGVGMRGNIRKREREK